MIVDVGPGEEGVDERTLHAKADDVGARNVEVRASTDAGAGKGGYSIVASSTTNCLDLSRADGNDCRGIRRTRKFVSGALVASGGNDDNSFTPSNFCGPGERVETPVGRGWSSVAEVDDPYVHAVGLAILYNPVNRCDDLRDVHAPVHRSDLDVHQSRIRGDPDECAPGLGWVTDVGVLTSNDSGHVGTVSEPVKEFQVVVASIDGKVSARNDRWSARYVRDAGVDEGDIDATTGESLFPEITGACDTCNRLKRSGVTAL